MPNYLGELGLSDDAVHARVRFLNECANRHREHAERVEGSDPWRRVALFGAAGTCAAQAAEFALLSDSGGADGLLRQAAQDYLHAELPYGLFLQTIQASDDGEIAKFLFNSPAPLWLKEVDRVTHRESEEESPSPERPIAPHLAASNQQFYLCAAMMSAPTVAREFESELKRLMGVLRKHPNLPHGPQGQPLQFQLDIVEPVFSKILDQRLPEGIGRPTRALGRLARHHAESIEAARRNTYLWKNLWSPIDYLDLEIVGAAICLDRAGFSVDIDLTGELDGVASIPIRIAHDRRQTPKPQISL